MHIHTHESEPPSTPSTPSIHSLSRADSNFGLAPKDHTTKFRGKLLKSSMIILTIQKPREKRQKSHQQTKQSKGDRARERGEGGRRLGSVSLGLSPFRCSCNGALANKSEEELAVVACRVMWICDMVEGESVGGEKNHERWMGSKGKLRR